VVAICISIDDVVLFIMVLVVMNKTLYKNV